MTYSLGIDNILVCSGEVIEFLIFTHCNNVCSKVVMVGHLRCSCCACVWGSVCVCVYVCACANISAQVGYTVIL